MPMYLDVTDVVQEVEGLASVLIVPCRFCPAASMAIRNNQPYLDVFRSGLKTASYEGLILRLQRDFEKRGIRTGVFRTRALHQFVLCMWTAERRRQLSECAGKFDAVVVLGCEAAVEAVSQAVGASGCRVIQGMQSEGVMSLKPKLRFPGQIWLELERVAPAETHAPRETLAT